MGYSMSRLELDFELFGRKISQEPDVNNTKQLDHMDHEIAQLTKLRSNPDHHLSRVTSAHAELPISAVKMLAAREGNYSGRGGQFSAADCSHMLSRYLPINGPSLVEKMKSRAYISQFSADGSRFISAFQGSNIRIYDVDREWKLQKNILAKSLRWTITDTSLSPDQRFLVYSSMSPIVHIVNVESPATESLANITEIHDGLDFSFSDDGEFSFAIFSVNFSTDGREAVAGSSDGSVYVYDIQNKKLSLRIPAHKCDVNTVCFADESGHLVYSGSDDCVCKVWDRRCFTARGKPAGVMVGHLEGVTFIDSRHDGRYFISNSKDQSTKLWDIRNMLSHTPRISYYGNPEWDYRWMDYTPTTMKHPLDHSVATYSGHSVLRTLIRCYFSPAYSTGQKFIYTGSSDSCVYIYDVVSGSQIARLKHHKLPVRDCSWHPTYPVLVSSSWDGSIMKWEFPGKADVPPRSTTKRRIKRRHQY